MGSCLTLVDPEVGFLSQLGPAKFESFTCKCF